MEGFKILILSFVSFHILIPATASKVSYPNIKRDDTVVTYFKKEIPNPYGWIGKLSGNETLLLRQEQNNLTQSYCAQLSSKERDTIRAQVTQYSQESLLYFHQRVIVAGSKIFLHEKYGDKIYMMSNTSIQDWDIIFSKENIPATCKRCKYIEKFNPSAFSNYVAVHFVYNLEVESYAGSYYFLNTKSGQFVDDRIDNVIHNNIYAGFSILNSDWTQWSIDGKGIFYLSDAIVSSNNTEKTVSIYYHEILTNQTLDIGISSFTSTRSLFFMKLTSDGKYLVVTELQTSKRPFVFIFHYVTLCAPFHDCGHKENTTSRQTLYKSVEFPKFLGNKGSVFYIQESSFINATSYRIIAIDISKNQTNDYTDAVLSHLNSTNLAINTVLTESNYLVTLTSNAKLSYRLHIRKLGVVETETEIPLLKLGQVIMHLTDSNIIAINYDSPLAVQSLATIDLSSESLDKIKPINLRLPLYAKKSIRDSVVMQREIQKIDSADMEIWIYRPNTIKLDGSAPLLVFPPSRFMPIYRQVSAKYATSFMEIFGGTVAFPIPASINRSVMGRSGNKVRIEEDLQILKSSVDWLIENKYTCPEKLTLFTYDAGTSVLGGGAITKYPSLFGSVILTDTKYLNLSSFFYTKASMEQYLPFSPIHNIQNISHGPAVMVNCQSKMYAGTGMEFIAALQNQYAKNANQIKPALAIFSEARRTSTGEVPTWIMTDADVDTFSFLALALDYSVKP